MFFELLSEEESLSESDFFLLACFTTAAGFLATSLELSLESFLAFACGFGGYTFFCFTSLLLPLLDDCHFLLLAGAAGLPFA